MPKVEIFASYKKKSTETFSSLIDYKDCSEYKDLGENSNRL